MMLGDERVFSRYVPGSGVRVLPDVLRALLIQQRRSWPMCRDGYASLAQVRTRDIITERFLVRLQFNPGRMTSTGAKVDAASIAGRRCFLCAENLPPEQRAVVYGGEWLLLVNPAPIFADHFTLSHVEHRPQDLRPVIGALLSLAVDLAPDYTLFYNGPRCGASAPDHLHFQAAPAGAIPLDREADGAVPRRPLGGTGGATQWTLSEYGRTVCIIEGPEPAAVERELRAFIDRWQELLGESAEPMLNLLCSARQGTIRATVVLRRKHRPGVYFLEGDGRVVISPAAVDIGGLVVTPVEKDFLTVDDRQVREIFREVCEEPALLERIAGSA